MSARRYARIWCDRSLCGTEPVVGGTAEAARTHARADGWVVGLRGGVDYCSNDCARLAGRASREETEG